MATLDRYPWPGNVRELMNILERLAILNSGSPIGPEEVRQVLPAVSLGPRAIPTYQEGDPRPLKDRLDDYERILIQGAMAGAKSNIAEAGRRLQTDRANLYRRMKRLGIRSASDEEE